MILILSRSIRVDGSTILYGFSRLSARCKFQSYLVISSVTRGQQILDSTTDKSTSAWECGKMPLHRLEEMVEIHMDEK
jgi:hypothetical protein